MLERTRSLGIVGAGGAGFPLYKKLESPAEILILNAAECEPLLHKDKEILHAHGEEVLDGMSRAMAQVQANRGILAIKGKYEDLIDELTEPARDRGISIFALGDFYPAGDEFVTVYEATGRIIPPGGLPLDVGCVVSNVETMLNLGLDRPVTHKFLTVGGAVDAPVTVRAPIGLSFGDLLESLQVDRDRIAHVLVGGVMMGRLMESWDEVVTRTTGALLCFPPDHPLPRRYLADAPQRDRIGKSACDQCSFCTELCPRYLLGHPVEPHLAMRGLGFHLAGDSMVLGSQFCCECNLCSLYSCPEDLFPKDACADNKRGMREQGVRHPATGRVVEKVHSMQAYRHIPVASLMKKLGLLEFTNVGPLVDVDWRFEELRLPLSQHVGAPAKSAVEVGQTVDVGDEIARAPEGLGVAIHASARGSVARVDPKTITLRRTDG
jgi:Na+-translocating ferredoxin:NAD+ oxidoreductase RnfC subunit